MLPRGPCNGTTQHMSNHDPSPVRLLNLKQVQERVPYSRTQLWRLERAGLFPRRIRIGANRITWLACEVEAWIKVRVDEREGGDDA